MQVSAATSDRLLLLEDKVWKHFPWRERVWETVSWNFS